MDSSRLTLVISIIFFTFPYPASPSGFLEIRLLHFSNPEGKAANGECCDQTGYLFKTCEPCDHTFVICLDDTAESSSFRSCRMGRLQTGRIKSNVITFNETLGDGVKNPLRFKFKTWPGIVKMKVAVLDYDDVNVRERVDHFEYQFRSSGGRERKYSLTRMLNLTGSISSISLQVKVYCDSHYYGPICNTFCMKTDSRKGHYTCGKKTGRKICNLGWMGKDCLQNQDDCLYNRCHKDAKCIDGLAFYKCQCPPGRTGILCDMDTNECASNPCLHGGTCQDRLNSFQCVCHTGFTGATCETRILPCESNPCFNGATCVPDSTSFICQCTELFEGKRCGVRKRYKHVCDQKPCQNGKCIPGSNPTSYTCSCLPGYTGKFCEIEIDGCSSNPCHNEAICVNGVNTFHCFCQPGYTGTLCEIRYYSCESNPCQNGGVCIDGIAHFFCRCDEHFEGERCELDTRLADPCQSSPCQNGAYCKADENGSDFICVCRPQNSGIWCEITESADQYSTATEGFKDSTSLNVSSLEEISTSQTTTTPRPTDYLTDHARTFTGDLGTLSTENESLLETMSKVTPEISLTSRSKRTPGMKKEFSSVLHALVSRDRPLSEVVTEVTPEVSLTSRSKRTPKTNEKSFSSGPHNSLTDANSSPKGASRITPDISSGYSSGEGDELFSSGLRAPLSDDTLTEFDATEVTRNIPITKWYTSRTKGELFITSTAAPTMSVSADFPTRLHKNFTSSTLIATSPNTTQKTPTIRRITSKIPLRRKTTTKVPTRKPPTRKIPGRRTTTTKSPLWRKTTTKVPTRKPPTRKIPGRRTTTTKSPLWRKTTTKVPVRKPPTGKIPGRRTTTTKSPLWRKTTTKVPVRKPPTGKIPGRRTTTTKSPLWRKTTTKVPTRKPPTRKIPGRRTTTTKSPLWRKTTTKVPTRKPPTRKITGRRTTTTKSPLWRKTTTKVPTRKPPTRKIPGRRTTTTKSPLWRKTTTKVPTRKPPTRKIPGRRTTTTRSPLWRKTTTKVTARKPPTRKIPGRRTTTTKNPLWRTTTTKVPARKPPTRKIPLKRTTTSKYPTRQTTTQRIPGRRTSTRKRTRTRPKTRKSRKKTTTIMTTTARPISPEICILVKIRPTSKIPKQIVPTERPGNGTLREEYTNPDTTRRVCWALKHETDFVFPAPQTEKPVALDMVTPYNWVNQILLSMIPNDNYMLLIKDALMNWVRGSLTIFLRHRHTNIPRYIPVFNSTCVVIVIKPKRIGGTAARIDIENKPPESLKMFVCRSEPTTTMAPTTTIRQGLILRIKVQNETHEEKKTIYPGTPDRPMVVIRVVTTARKAVEYGKEVATKAFRKTKVLLHKTLRKLSGVWKDVKLISDKLSGPVAASREAIRRVWNDAWENTQKAYERTQQLVRRAYQKARETFKRYIDNIKVTGREAYVRTYETYLKYYNDYTQKVRKTATVFRQNYDRYTDYLRNYWKELGN